MKPSFGARCYLNPMPVTLVGAHVAGEPNFITVSNIGLTHPFGVSVSMASVHYTTAGIEENGTFSVNIPSVEMIREADYCGMVSGENTNKSGLFNVFHGKLKTAPMIMECPINMECEVMETVEFPGHRLFVGKVLESYCDERYLTDGSIDFSKVQPFFFSVNDRQYWKLGEPAGKGWQIGKDIKSRFGGSSNENAEVW